MKHNPRFEAFLQNLKPNAASPVGLLQKISALAATIVLFGLALTFSVVLFAVVVTVGVVFLGYAWWKTRALRKAMREAQERTGNPTTPGTTSSTGIVLEGEVLREIREDQRDQSRN